MNLYIALLTKTRVFTMGYKTDGKETIKVKSCKLKNFLKKCVHIICSVYCNIRNKPVLISKRFAATSKMLSNLILLIRQQTMQ